MPWPGRRIRKASKAARLQLPLLSAYRRVRLASVCRKWWLCGSGGSCRAGLHAIAVLFIFNCAFGAGLAERFGSALAGTLLSTNCWPSWCIIGIRLLL